jgi:hypothetical protein
MALRPLRRFFRGEPASAVHVAFAADDRASVHAFREAAIGRAGTTAAVPGLARVPSDLLRGLRPRSGRQQHRSGPPWSGRGSLSRRSSIHRSAWKGPSPTSGCSILDVLPL